MNLSEIPLQNTPKSQHDAEITYTVPELSDKLYSYQIKPATISAKLQINNLTLKQAAVASDFQTNEYLLAFHNTLKDWQFSQEFSDFCMQINHLIYCWVNAVHNGASTVQIISVLKSFELKSMISNAKTTQFHCFLLDLLFETCQKFQQLRLDYLLNIHANTQLPNANNIAPTIEQIFDAAANNQLISFFSIHFQLSKNNPIYLQWMAVELESKISHVLKDNIEQSCIIFYSGNLQFEILSSHLSNEIQINLLIAKLQRAFDNMQSTESESILITPFIGCAASVKSAADPTNIFVCARLALESAITTQQSFVMYSEVLKNTLNEQKNTENKILEAFNYD